MKEFRVSKSATHSKTTLKGFTLLEVMIAIVIMSFMAVLVTTAVQSATRSKAKVEDILDQESQVLDTLRLLERDISNAFHGRDLAYELQAAVNKGQQSNQGDQPNSGDTQGQPPPDPSRQPQQAQPDPNNPAAANQLIQTKPSVQLTQFEGSANSLYLTTRSHQRSVRDSKQSDIINVGYYVKSCRRAYKNESSEKCLWRKTNYYLDLDITRGGTDVVLLENIDELKFRYFGPGREEWVDRWVTGERGEDFSKGVFPHAVEVQLKVRPTGARVKPDAPSIARTMVIPIRFPNNPKNPNEPASDGRPNENGLPPPPDSGQPEAI